MDQTIASLAPGASRGFNPVHRITQDDLNRGYFDNTAMATTNYGGTNINRTASASVTANIGPEIDITKRAQESSYSSAGTIIHYTLVVTNTGNVTLSGIIVTDPLTGLDQNIGSLAPGASSTMTETYTVTLADLNSGQIDNTATATGTYAGDTYTDQASVTVPGTQDPEIRIVKTAQETSFTAPGQTINYTLTVTNTGNVTLTNVVVTDPYAVVSCPQPSYTLVPGQTVTCTATHTVTAADVTAQRFRNVATVTGNPPSGPPVTDDSEAVVSLSNQAPVIQCPPAIVTGTSATTCDITINTGLGATFSDPNGNVESLTWVMTGATTGQSPDGGINNIGSHTFNLGVTTVTYTVTDALGLSATCSFTVTVIDDVIPVAVCADIDVYLDPETGEATIDVDDIDDGSIDNCGIASMTISDDHFDCTDIASIQLVTLTVTDNAGNVGTCVANVTVHYAEPPDPRATPAADVICNGETINLVLSSNLPTTTWTWTLLLHRRRSPVPAGMTAACSQR